MISISILPTGESFTLFKVVAGLWYDLHNKFQFITLSTGILMILIVTVSRCLVVALGGKKSVSAV